MQSVKIMFGSLTLSEPDVKRWKRDFYVWKFNKRKISFRKMFGEYTFYSKGKAVALICDNQLYAKPTKAGKEYIGEFVGLVK